MYVKNVFMMQIAAEERTSMLDLEFNRYSLLRANLSPVKSFFSIPMFLSKDEQASDFRH
jgi:hypothetical protein